MNFQQICNKAFTGGFWFVGIKKKNYLQDAYERVEVAEGQWLADPFLYEYNGKHYLFVEQYFNKRNRAALGVYDIVDGKAVNNRVIMEQPYHLSYPNVFYYKGEHWMIPESSSNQSLDLYHALSFPDKWEHVATLMSNCRVADTTTYIKGDTIYLISYEKSSNGWKLVLYLFDMDSLSMKRIADTCYEKNVGRPAGRFFEKDGRLYRPAQNCAEKYGESLLIYEITTIDSQSYQEKLVGEIQKKDIVMKERFERIHTLNSDSLYEVIDAYQEHFEPLQWWKIIKRQYLNN